MSNLTYNTPCPQCGKKFLNKTGLAIHIGKAHNIDHTEKCKKWETKLWICEDFSAGSKVTRWIWKIYVFKPRAQIAYAIIQPGFLNYESKDEARKNASNMAREFGLNGKWMSVREG